MAQYEVVPFVARISNQDDAGAAASQLRDLVNNYAQQGWKFVSVNNVEIHQAGTAGCFGIGATPGRVLRYDMVVFEK